MHKPPIPVIGAVVLTALIAAAMLVGMILVIISSGPGGALFAVVVLLPGATAYGLWQGRRGSRIVAIILGVMLFSGGLGRRETSVVGPVFAALQL
jgi:hypothetical protein